MNWRETPFYSGGAIDPQAMSLATNSHDPDELERLSHHDHPQIRAYVAENPHTPIEVLVKLKNDSSDLVKIYVLRNTQITNDFCKSMFLEHDAIVRKEAFSLAISRYKLAQIELSHKDVVTMVDFLLETDIRHPRYGTLDVIEVVEKIHTIRERNLKNPYDTRSILQSK